MAPRGRWDGGGRRRLRRDARRHRRDRPGRVPLRGGVVRLVHRRRGRRPGRPLRPRGGVPMMLTSRFATPDGFVRPPAAHRATTAHLQAAYPFVAEGGLPCGQVYIGRDLYGSSFCYDPWQLYAAKVITSTNAVVVGQIGLGKSACVKTLLDRQVLHGRKGV